MPIVSFACKHTQALFEGHYVQRLSGIRGVAERKLQQLDAAETLAFLRSPPEIGWKSLWANGPASIVYELMINGAFVLSGQRGGQAMSRLWTITKG